MTPTCPVSDAAVMSDTPSTRRSDSGCCAMNAFQPVMSRTVSQNGSAVPATWPSVMLTAESPALRASASERASMPRVPPRYTAALAAAASAYAGGGRFGLSSTPRALMAAKRLWITDFLVRSAIDADGTE